jgi:hypothetical protein
MKCELRENEKDFGKFLILGILWALIRSRAVVLGDVEALIELG